MQSKILYFPHIKFLAFFNAFQKQLGEEVEVQRLSHKPMNGDYVKYIFSLMKTLANCFGYCSIPPHALPKKTRFKGMATGWTVQFYLALKLAGWLY